MSRIDGYNFYQQALINQQTMANEIAGSKDGKRDPRIPQNSSNEEAAIYEQAVAQKPVTYSNPTIGVKKNEHADIMSTLSDAAKKLLDELKKKKTIWLKQIIKKSRILGDFSNEPLCKCI